MLTHGHVAIVKSEVLLRVLTVALENLGEGEGSAAGLKGLLTGLLAEDGGEGHGPLHFEYNVWYGLVRIKSTPHVMLGGAETARHALLLLVLPQHVGQVGRLLLLSPVGLHRLPHQIHFVLGQRVVH